MRLLDCGSGPIGEMAADGTVAHHDHIARERPQSEDGLQEGARRHVKIFHQLKRNGNLVLGFTILTGGSIKEVQMAA